MKHKLVILVALMSLVFVACNKDEDIVIDDPQPENPAPEIPADLGYSVLEYTPAPGQYINESASGFNEISSSSQACAYAEERLSKGLFVSLGAWGGYIVVKFDKSIKNSGDYDFAISSNSFDTSNEPGIVWVMQDANKNGIPDDTWFELKGSHFGEEGYERNYWVTYSRPAPEADTPWIDSNGETGVIRWMSAYHTQPYYYPDWINEDSYTLYGSRLPSQARQNPVSGIWENLPFQWGYADNFGQDFFADGNRNLFKISNAVTEENLPANLSSIDFVKVQTAINGDANLLGENSTEVCGFFSL